MQKGTVKFFNSSKGYGFIKTNNQEIFVHYTGLIDQIKKDDMVQFEVKDGRKGLNAIKVKLLQGELVIE